MSVCLVELTEWDSMVHRLHAEYLRAEKKISSYDSLEQVCSFSNLFHSISSKSLIKLLSIPTAHVHTVVFTC